MNTRSVTHNVARQGPARQTRTTNRFLANFALLGLLLGLAAMRIQAVAAQTTVNEAALHQLILYDQGQQALALVAEESMARGNWGPAPGDEVVFAPNMVEFLMARTVAIDAAPDDCDLPRNRQTRNLEPRHPDCGRDFQFEQDQIQFGVATFAIQIDDVISVPRPLDDILSVYIEEVGHSWQEYCYETEGRCAGERTRLTRWGAGMHLAAGWEYQVKMYILGLDGNVLHLSDKERSELMAHICDGYANPIYSEVLPYGPPDAWIDADAWPLVAPTAAEHAAFCASV